MIPIANDLMSVGVVLPRAAFQQMPTLDPAELLDRAIAETPVVARMLSTARREWPVRVERDFSFSSRAYAGDRWLLDDYFYTTIQDGDDNRRTRRTRRNAS